MDADILGLIDCIDVLPFDFQQLPSKDERDSIAVARSLLFGGTPQGAKKLWHDVVDRARETRVGSGTLDMAALRRWLRPRFTLKDLPDYEPSWARLHVLSAENESLIQTALPSGARRPPPPALPRRPVRLGKDFSRDALSGGDQDLPCTGTS